MDSDYWKKARGEMIKPPERQFLFDTAQQIAAKFTKPVIVNIGVSWGASVHCLFAGAPKAKHYAIDIDYDTRPIQGRDLLDVTFILADSGKWKPPFDKAHLVFVDGNHSYEAVSLDTENWTQYIPIGGIIAFHDYNPQPRDRQRLQGVQDAVDEWYKPNEMYWKRLGVFGSIVAFERVI